MLQRWAGFLACQLLVVGVSTAAALWSFYICAQGVSVTVGGAPAPIVAVADLGGYQQINFEVPQEALPNTDGTWTVTATQNATQITGQVEMSQSPGDFFQVGNLGAVQHASDFSLVTEQNPARPGEVLVGYLTGLPVTQPTVPTGEAAPFCHSPSCRGPIS